MPARDEGARPGATVRRRGVHRHPDRPCRTRGGRRDDGRGAGLDRPRRVGRRRRRADFAEGTRLAYVTQTTLSVDETGEIITALRARFPEIYAPKKEDICYATSNRQWAVKEMLAEIDLLLVIGSRNSSNSNRLVEVARANGVAGAPDRRRVRDRRGLARRRRDRRHHLRRVRAREACRAGLRLVPRARRRPRSCRTGWSTRTSSFACRSSCAASSRSRRYDKRPSRPARAQGADLDRNGERLGASRSPNRSTSSASGQPEPDPVGEGEAGLLAQHVHLVDPVETALEPELVVELGVDRDGDAVFARQPPSPRGRRARRAPRRARVRGRRPGSDRRRALRTPPARVQRGHLGSAAPSFGPSTGRFGLTRSSEASTSPNPPPDPQLLGDLLRVPVRERPRACDDEPAQRLSQLELRDERA